MQQLKERFKQYEPMKSDMKAKTKFGERKDDEAKRSAIRKQSRQTNSDPKRSSNCGGDDHSSVTCPKKEKGVRCVRCNEFGHMASRCTAQPKKTYIISRPEKKRYMKDVTIDECRFTSLVDTGSDLTFIRSDEYARLGSPPLGNGKLRFDGLGSTGNETWGEFTKIMMVEHVISNCLDYIPAERKSGKQEGYLNPLDKGDTPLDTYHIDHVGPMTATRKRYVHIFVVVDAFTKFTWLYPTKSTDAADVIDRLKRQAAVFGNSRRIISDRGTAFTSNAFREYCEEENIEHLLTTTGVPRRNGQAERQDTYTIINQTGCS